MCDTTFVVFGCCCSNLLHSADNLPTYDGDATRRRMRAGNYEPLEDELMKWIDTSTLLFHQMNAGVSMPLIQSKATELNKTKFHYPQFTACNGWFSRFCSRYDLRRVILRGEAGDVDLSIHQNDLIDLRVKLSSYKPDHIFNMDETGLFFRALPNSLYARSRVVTAKNVRGSKKMVAKDRLTLVVCANASGVCVKHHSSTRTDTFTLPRLMSGPHHGDRKVRTAPMLQECRRLWSGFLCLATK